MRNKINFIKFTSLILVIALISSFVGCKRGKEDTSPNDSLSSSLVSSSTESKDDTSSTEEIIDDVSDNTNTSSDDIDLDFDLSADSDLSTDTSDDLFEDLDLKVYQTVKFDNVAEQKNYAGMTGILPSFWFMPDSTMEKPYTEKQIEISIKKFLQMGVTIVRAHAFSCAWAWDADNDKWDWDSEWMKGFYKYCDLMKENNIDIIWNPAEVVYKSIDGFGLENPLPIIAQRDNPDVFANFNSNSPTDEQKKCIAELYGQFYVDFYNEVIVKRGYSNIKYFQPGTEPNNGSEGFANEKIREDYEDWLLSFAAAHNAMKNAGYRNKVKFIGPSVVIPYRDDASTVTTAYKWLEWCVKEIDYMIDIYAAHQYGRPSSSSQDWTEEYNTRYIEPCKKIVKSTGKPLWCDEFNVDDDKYSGVHITREDPLMATQLAYGYLRHMIGGIQATPIWYLVDIKWPNITKTTTDSWEEGIHKCGVDVSVLESTIPSNGYYVYCMLGSTVRSGDIVYEGISEYGNVYSVMLKHTDGTYSFITVNFGWEENQITYKLPINLKNSTYEKTVYDPLTFKATTQYKLIEPSKEIKNVKNTFTDTIGSYQVCVYNLK